MLFSSLEFLFLFLPATFIIYFIVPARFIHIRNLVLLLLSLVFYGWGEPKYVFLMIGTIAIDYLFGFLVGKYRDGNKNKAKLFLILSVVINLAILGFFKYYDFLASSINSALTALGASSQIPLLNLSLPIGISFYTFQALSYVIDIYRGEAAVQKNIASFGAYVTLFPQLIAGPIVRYRDIDGMLRERDENVALFASGVRTFACGLAKKVLLANTAGELWKQFSSRPSDALSVAGAWMGIIFYTFQIYFDFSGYSDMAIGLGKMFGFRFLENFNYPYIAKSITDFWRRWHMSLSTWFREYVYIPLGGSKNGKARMIFSMLAVWALTGLWHGASWNFLLWGLYYFVLLIIEKLLLKKLIDRAPGFVGHIYTLFFVVIGWLLFVSEDMGAGLAYLGNLFGSGVASVATQADLYEFLRNLPFVAVMCVSCTPLPKKIYYKLYAKGPAMSIISAVLSLAGVVLCVAYLTDSSFNPFLYFRF